MRHVMHGILLLSMLGIAGCEQAPALPDAIPAVATPFGTTASWTPSACIDAAAASLPQRIVVPHTLGVASFELHGGEYEQVWDHRPRIIRWEAWGQDVAVLTGSELVVLDANGARSAAVPATNRSVLAAAGDHLLVGDRGAVEVRDRDLAVVGRVELPQDTPGTSAPHDILVAGDRAFVLDNREPPVDALVLDLADLTSPRIAARTSLGENVMPLMQWLDGDTWHVVVEESRPLGEAVFLVRLDPDGRSLEKTLLHAIWDADDGTRHEAGVLPLAVAMPWIAFEADGLWVAHWADGPGFACAHTWPDVPQRPVGLAAWPGGVVVARDARIDVMPVEGQAITEIDLGPHAWDVLVS